MIFFASSAIISNVVNLGVAQLGRALPWGGRGRGFKSRHSDQLKNRTVRCGFLVDVCVWREPTKDAGHGERRIYSFGADVRYSLLMRKHILTCLLPESPWLGAYTDSTLALSQL